MRTEFEMEIIINKSRAVERKRQIILLKDDLKNYPQYTGSPLPRNEMIKMAIDNGKQYTASRIKYI